MKGFPASILFFFILILPVRAGWELKIKSSHSDSDEGIPHLVYFQDNVIKVVEAELTTIFDLNDNVLTFIKPQIHMFWKGNLDEYRKEVHETLELMIKMEVDKLPDDQKEEGRKILESMIRIMENPDTLSFMDILTRETGEIEEIGGYETRKYQFFLNGVITEDLWIARDLDVSEDLDMGKYLLLLSQLRTGFENELLYQTTEEYYQIIQNTYVLRSREYHTGYQTVKEVIEIQEKDLDKSVFLPPENYKPVSLSELGIITTGDEE
jgi:hypothetical protein